VNARESFERFETLSGWAVTAKLSTTAILTLVAAAVEY
jgi:hypothetical protein